MNYLLKKTKSQSNLLISAINGGNLEILNQILEADADINRLNNSGVTPLVESKNVEFLKFLIKKGADVNQMIDSKCYGIITPVIYVLKTNFLIATHTLELVKVLVENGASVNGRDKKNNTALMIAAKAEGSKDMLQILLDHGADISAKDKEGNTALIIALNGWCFQNASFLLQFIKCIDVLNAQNHTGSTALMCAVKVGKLSLVTELINLGADVNATDVKGKTALMMAANKEEGVDMLKIMLDHGADIYAKDKEGNTALIIALNGWCFQNASFLLQFINCRDALNAKNDTGSTALMCAVKWRQLSLVTELINLGADVNATDAKGKTALMIAAQKEGSKDMLQILLDHGANLCDKDKDGNTPLNIALNIWCFQNASFLLQFIKCKDVLNAQNHTGSTALMWAVKWRQLSLVTELINLGADVNVTDAKGETALMMAAIKEKSVDMLQILLDHGADISARDKEGNTALIISLNGWCFQNASFLLQFIKCKDVLNAQNHTGSTALMVAVNWRKLSLVTELINLGADVNVTDTKGKTALMIAAQKEGSKDMLQILLDHGANLCDTDEEGNTPLNIALNGWCFQNASFLLQFIKCKNVINAQNYTGSTALLWAVRWRQLSLVTELISLGVDVNATDAKGKTALMMAAIKEENGVEMLQILLDHGADISAKDKEGNTALIIAINGLCFQNALFLLQFIKCKDVLNAQNHTCSTALMCAVTCRKLSLVTELINLGADVDATDAKGKTALMMAAIKEESVDMLKIMLDHGADISAKDKEGNTALIIALNGGCCQNASFLLQFIKCKDVLNAHNQAGSTALMWAVKWRGLSLVRDVINLGADVNATGAKGETALMMAANKEESVDMLQILLDHGADISAKDKEGNNALIIALKGGCCQNASFLLQFIKCKDVLNSQNHTGSTALMCAVTWGKLNLVIELLSLGVDVNATDAKRKTAIMMAAAKEENGVEMLQILLDHGADISAKDEDGNTALIIAINGWCYQNASFLLQCIKCKGVLNAQNHAGSTALMCAVTWGKLNLVIELISLGVDVNATDAKGNTALMQSLMKFFGWENDILTTLITAGSDVNYQNNEGFSPLMLAANNRLKHAIQILLDSGANVNAVSKSNDTALSYLFKKLFLREDTKCCMEYLLERGASASYVSPRALMKIIYSRWTDVIPKMIQRGLGPASLGSDEFTYAVLEFSMDFYVSPLCISLLVGNIDLARYFMGNLFLTHSDMSLLTRNKGVRRYLEQNNLKNSLNFLDEMSSQLFSLFKLSLVAVSSFIGASPGRENRVNLLPLPQVMKNTLLFKTEEVLVTSPTFNKFDIVYGD